MSRKWKQREAEDARLKEKRDSFEFEKGDGMAMFIAAIITFLPALLLVIGAFVLIVWIIFH